MVKYTIGKDGVVINVKFSGPIVNVPRPKLTEEMWEDHLNGMMIFLDDLMSRLRELHVVRKGRESEYQALVDSVLDLEEQISCWYNVPYAV